MLKGKLQELIKGVRDNDRVLIGRALSLIESTLEADRKEARIILRELLTLSGNSIRLGITGVPGSGKSTFIESFGLRLCESGKKVAVLSIDPSSPVSKGSILGDKTRMEKLSKNQNAFIRPSPAGNMLGGIARNTREAIIILEAAGYDYIIIETVGVGQSEISVGDLVDVFVLVLISGAGDELQGIKKGIMEKAQLLLVNKSDGKNKEQAMRAKKSLENALSILYSNLSDQQPKVLAISSLGGNGIEVAEKEVNNLFERLKSSGQLEGNRFHQNAIWFDWEWKAQMEIIFRSNSKLLELKDNLLEQIENGEKDPFSAADELVEAFKANFLS